MTFRLSPNSPKSGAFGDRALQPRCSCPPLEKSGTVGNRSLQPHCSSTFRRARGPRPTASLLVSLAGGGAGGGCSSTLRRVRGPRPTTSLLVSPAGGGAGGGHSLLVARCFSPLVVRQPCGTVGNRSLQPHCSSTLRRVRGPRPTTSLLVNPAERLGTAPYNLIARLLCGAFGDRALQPRCSSTLRRVRGPRPRAVIPIMMWIPKSGAFGDRALQPRQPCGTVGNRSLQPRCSLLVARRFSLLVALFLSPLAHRLSFLLFP